MPRQFGTSILLPADPTQALEAGTKQYIDAGDAARQPLDSDLTTIAGLTPGAGNVLAADGSGWISKTYSALKTALGLNNVDNTADTAKPVSTAQQTALNGKLSLSTVTTKGDLLVATASGTITRRPVGSNNQVFTADSSQPDGVKWAAPAAAVQSVNNGDSTITVDNTDPLNPLVKVSSATLAAKANTASPTFTGTSTFQTLVNAPVTLTDAATILVDASLGNHFKVTLGGNRTMGAPSTPADGQMIIFEIIQDGTGGRTLTWTSGAGGYQFDAPAQALTGTIGARDFLTFIYNSTSNRWVFAVPTVAVGTIAETQVTNLVTDLAAKAPLAGPTFTGVATFAKTVNTPVVLTDAATIAVDASLGNVMRVTLGGNRTMGVPTNPTDGQVIVFELIQDATGSRLVTWSSGAGGFAFDTISAPSLTTTPAERDYVTFIYSSVSSRWQYAAPPAPSWNDRVETLTDGASVTPNANSGLVQCGIWTCNTATPTLFAPANAAQGQPYRVIVNAAGGVNRVITLSGFQASTDDPTTAVTVLAGKWCSLYFEYISAIGWLYMGKKAQS